MSVFDSDGCIALWSRQCDVFFLLFIYFIWPFPFCLVPFSPSCERWWMEWEQDNSMFLVCFFFGLPSLTFSFSYLLILLPFCSFTFPLCYTIYYSVLYSWPWPWPWYAFGARLYGPFCCVLSPPLPSLFLDLYNGHGN